MADRGDQKPAQDAPTNPFRKVVLPAEQTVRIQRPASPGPSRPQQPSSPPPQQAPTVPQPLAQPDRRPPSQPNRQPDPNRGPDPGRPDPNRQPQQDPKRQQDPSRPPQSNPNRQPQPGREPDQQPNQQPNQQPDQQPGRQPGRQPWLQQRSTPPSQPDPLPPPNRLPPPPSESLPPLPPDLPSRGLLSRLGDIPIKVVYLFGAIVATVLAVLLVFVVFSGDVPKPAEDEQPQVAGVSPVPSAAPTAKASPKPSVTPTALPAVPKSRAYPVQPGVASVVTGLISDTKSGLSYPRLNVPWAAKSFPPFSVAQRIGKVGVPQTVIASAMFPGDPGKAKPSTDADYRALAVKAVRWTLTTQYPAGAKPAWTGSQKVPLGKGWMLGYKVTYQLSGKQHTAQAVLSLHEVSKTKPAILLASITDGNKAHWIDLNTLVKGVRPL